MEFTAVNFFGYDIRSTVMDSVRMFLVSDLLNQYNTMHNTNKVFQGISTESTDTGVTRELAKLYTRSES